VRVALRSSRNPRNDGGEVMTYEEQYAKALAKLAVAVKAFFEAEPAPVFKKVKAVLGRGYK
jgi:hypothetical protein